MTYNANARRLFTEHETECATDRLSRDNCHACILAGWEGTEEGPNAVCWERDYVNAELPIPSQWRVPFFNALNGSGPYAEHLREDVTMHGVRWGR